MSDQTPHVVLHFDGLVYTAPKGHACTDIVRNLPVRRYTGYDTPQQSAPYPPSAWVLPLTSQNLPGLRKLYAAGTQFSPEAIDALKALSMQAGASSAAPTAQAGSQGQPARTDAPRPAQARPGAYAERVAVTPDVCAPLRGLPCSVDPTDAGANGDGSGQQTVEQAPSSDPAGFVRVVYTLAPDNSLQYHLKRLPEGRVLTGEGAGPFASVHEAQDAATRFNTQEQEQSR